MDQTRLTSIKRETGSQGLFSLIEDIVKFFYHYRGLVYKHHICLFQMYGQKLIEFVQGPGEVIFLPRGLTHAVLNIRDNVAYTENILYVHDLPGKIYNYKMYL